MTSLKSLLQDCRGFTLPEVIVSVGVLSIVMGILGTAMFQALGTEGAVIDDGKAINELRKGFSWFSEDVKMAQSTDLTDGAPAVSSVTLSWTDEFGGVGASHTSSYALVGDRLVRTYDGVAHDVARGVVSASFSLSGSTVTAQVEVTADLGTTRTLSVSTMMRSTS